jgi:Ca2+-binding RTX toxin-like protein
MGTYTGTSGRDTITPGVVSPGVTADPPGSTPSNADDTINGLAGNDTLGGGGGNDTIDGGAGNDTIDGGAGNDTINGRGGNDTIDGGAGNDRVDGGDGNDVVHLGAGDDYVNIVSTGNDTFYGEDGNDFIDGWTGNETYYGGAGNDTLNGRGGTDVLVGGTGRDSLTGGSDPVLDYFRFSQGDSPSTNAGADVITDWNVAYDYIDMPIAGTSTNYGEARTYWTDIEGARYHAENTDLRYEDHVFLYNSDTDTGYLVSDLDRNYTFETGVVLTGAGSATDMNWSDIV